MAGHGEAAQLHHGLAPRARRGLGRVEVRDVAPDHAAGHLVLACLRRRAGMDHRAVAHDGDPVGHEPHLVELVRGEQDRGSGGAQRADLLEQDLGLGVGEHRRRLVHHENTRAARQRLGDLDHLLVGVRQPRNRRSGVHRAVQPVEEPLRLPAHGGAVGQRPAPDLAAQKHVLLDGELLGEVELLVDHHDPGLLALMQAGKPRLLPVEFNAPGGGGLVARHDLHGGGFARPVLSDQRVDLAGIKVEIDPVQHLDRPEAAPYLAQRQDRRGAHSLVQAASAREEATQAAMKPMPAMPSPIPGSSACAVSRSPPACTARIASAASA